MSPRERAVLEAMISHAHDFAESSSPDAASRQRWLAQLGGTRAGRRCECGTCPSIALEDASGRTPTMADSRVVLSADAPGALLLLFIDDDQLSYLELAPLEPDARIAEFPAVEFIGFAPAGPEA